LSLSVLFSNHVCVTHREGRQQAITAIDGIIGQKTTGALYQSISLGYQPGANDSYTTPASDEAGENP